MEMFATDTNFLFKSYLKANLKWNCKHSYFDEKQYHFNNKIIINFVVTGPSV